LTASAVGDLAAMASSEPDVGPDSLARLLVDRTPTYRTSRKRSFSLLCPGAASSGRWARWWRTGARVRPSCPKTRRQSRTASSSLCLLWARTAETASLRPPDPPRPCPPVAPCGGTSIANATESANRAPSTRQVVPRIRDERDRLMAMRQPLQQFRTLANMVLGLEEAVDE